MRRFVPICRPPVVAIAAVAALLFTTPASAHIGSALPLHAAHPAKLIRSAAVSPAPANAMVAVGWEAGVTRNAAGRAVGRLLLHVGTARLEMRYPTREEAAHDGPRMAARLALAASSRASLSQVKPRALAGAAAVMWQGRILALLTRSQAREWREEPLVTVTRWSTALRQAALGTARSAHLPRVLVVPAGGQRVLALPIAWMGAEAVKSEDPAVLSARLGPGAQNLLVSGRTAGVTRLVLRRKQWEAIIGVEVREPAGRLPSTVGVTLTGVAPDAELAIEALQGAMEQAAHIVPGATLTPYWQEVAADPTHVTAWLEGPGLIPVVASVALSTRLADEAVAHPTSLAASNQPERLETDGVLLDTSLGSGNSVYYYHHENATGAPDRMLEVRLENREKQTTVLLVTQSGAGPSRDELYAGHTATWRYLRWMTRGNAWEVHIPPGGTYVLDRRRLSGGEVGCGLGQVARQQGPAPSLVVEARTVGLVEADSAAESPGPLPEIASATVRGRGLYPGPERELNATYRVGGPYAFIPVGGEPYLQPLGEGTPNVGNYGVAYRVHIHVENPNTELQRIYLVFSAAGGVVRGSLQVDGRLVETPVLSLEPGRLREYGLAEYDVPSGETREINVLAIPEPGSNYPIRLVVKPRPANQ